MSNKKTDDIKNMSVEDVLASIKAPAVGEKKSKCVLIKKIETLPANISEALMLAIDNPDVSNRDILGFINTKTDVKVNLSNVQNHRSKAGCISCMFGSSSS